MAIDVTGVVGIITQIPKLVNTVSDIVDSLKAALSEDDIAKLNAALDTLKIENDQAFIRVRQKLEDASKL